MCTIEDKGGCSAWTGRGRRTIAGEVLRAPIGKYQAVMAPWLGGREHGGWDREHGIEAIREFTQSKSIWISTAEAMDNPLAAASG